MREPITDQTQPPDVQAIASLARLPKHLRYPCDTTLRPLARAGSAMDGPLRIG